MYARHEFFEEEAIDGSAIAHLLVNMAWLAINLLLIHLMISRVAQIFGQAKDTKDDEKQLLNNVEEGVVVV